MPPPNLNDADSVIDLLDRAAACNLEAPLRCGGAVHLPGRGRVVMTGDLHDHAPNFQRLFRFAGLDQGPDRYLVLHELIHGKHQVAGCDMSIRLLLKAAALKVERPRQVHLLLSNHELAQVRGEDILKAGTSVIGAFSDGVEFIFGDAAGAVARALDRYVRSMPLAIRCANGLLLCHSLPSPARLAEFDPTVLSRVATEEDLSRTGSAYLMVWGRSHTQELADKLAAAWGATQFVMGHQPAESGYLEEGDSMLVLASDHELGMALPIDLSRSYTRAELIEALVPIAAIP